MTIPSIRNVAGRGRAAIPMLLVAASWLAGCDWFDPALYMERDAGADGGEVDLSLADRCDPASVPLVSSGGDFHRVDTRGLDDTVDTEATSCADHAAAGNDGFLAIEMRQGEKWHFHVRMGAGDAEDPSVYVYSSCGDLRACIAGIDVCSQRDEHLSFIAPADGTYYVGVDSRDPGGNLAEVLVIHPTCGNGGDPEHSEGCEDGNTDSGDGCDAECRTEIAVGGEEVEPNDDVTAANVLPAGGTYRGRIASGCDIEQYAVRVEDGQSIAVHVRELGDRPCGATAPALQLSLSRRVEPDAVAELLGNGVARAEVCPEIDPTMDSFASGLSAGEHYIRLASPSADRPFDYEITVEITGP